MEKDISLNEKPSFKLENHEKPWNTSEESFQNVGKEQVDSLRKLIKEVNEQIQHREFLSKNIFQECEKLKTEINNFIAESKAVDPTDSKERTALRQKQVDLAELQINEKISCWKDIALLKKELREYQKELEDREERMSMLDKILEEK